MALGVREVQATPNPNAMKFILNERISGNPLSFYSLDQAKEHPLAARLLSIAGVTNVLLLGDFVTIGKNSTARWSDITNQVKKALASD
jgi:hypothetical protein